MCLWTEGEASLLPLEFYYMLRHFLIFTLVFMGDFPFILLVVETTGRRKPHSCFIVCLLSISRWFQIVLWPTSFLFFFSLETALSANCPNPVAVYSVLQMLFLRKCAKKKRGLKCILFSKFTLQRNWLADNWLGRILKQMSSIEKSSNIVWHECSVSKPDRQNLLQQKGCVIWITGLSGSG